VEIKCSKAKQWKGKERKGGGQRIRAAGSKKTRSRRGRGRS